MTVGRDPGTGKQIQRSFSGKTQKEVREKMQAAAVSVNEDTYTEPSKMTVGQWLDIWQVDYLGGLKPFTVASYRTQIKNHIMPAFGAMKLKALDAHTIQRFYNRLTLSPKTIKNIHGVLHKALQQAVALGYIRFNPSDSCTLPRMEKRKISPLDEEQSKAFLQAIRGHRFEVLYTVALLTGMREGEVLGLTWDCVDFDKGTILINKQLQREKKPHGQYLLVATKNDKSRTITPAPLVMKLLRSHRTHQSEQRLKAGPLWEDSGLVFTDVIGCRPHR